jgi:hypothetical protein
MNPSDSSPFESGSWFCGIPNCAGHQVVDGCIEIPTELVPHLEPHILQHVDIPKKLKQ